MTKARTAGLFYLLVFVTGGFALAVGGKYVVPAEILAHETAFRSGCVLTLVATACYIAVTALFYELFRPVNKSLSLTAAFFSLTGCGIGAMSVVFQAAVPLILKDAHFSSGTALLLLRLSVQVSNVGFVFFGFYCVSIGFLIFGSNFLPRLLGAGMVIAGLGWLTFSWPPLASSLAPYNMIPGMLGEAALTLWLLTMGVNAERWNQQLIAVPEH